jgi:hypothetical protein
LNYHTKYHRLDVLNNRPVFLTVLVPGKFKVNIQCLVRALFLACNGCLLTVSSHGGDRVLSSSYYYEGMKLYHHDFI